MWPKLNEAIAFAALAHSGQVRKYTGEPYIVHPIEVMQILYDNLDAVSENELCAAVLHDVIEDTPVSLETIRERFGLEVASLVYELTEPKIEGNRKFRKQAEAQRLAGVSWEAQTIKYADLISNTRSIVAHDPNFAKLYLAEKAHLLSVMTEGDPKLRLEAERSLAQGQAALSLDSLVNE
ncbi:MAG: HD domain-containing protein [Sphingomonas sp.]|uniref:HD domain-containing protein n=1 Tax=Sphingomonas sp. TaxID=28214 RepID=UPI003F81579D